MTRIEKKVSRWSVFVVREYLVLLLYVLLLLNPQHWHIFRDDAQSSPVPLPAVEFPSNSVQCMMQHVRNTHRDSVFYNSVVEKSQEEVELEIREDRRKRRRM